MAERTHSSFLIAATSSGSGKTTLTMGVLQALCERGLRVQPFKCGPDYIDTKFHERVCGRPSINLDTFMATDNHVRALFSRYGADADVCVVEGMMGLFDGYDRDRGSSAEIARVLGVPVVLVVDAKSAAYSTAALLQGFLHFRENLRIAGVIFNKVGSAKHRKMLEQVCKDLRVACFGYLPKRAALEQGSRYLGLDFSETTDSQDLAAWVEEHVDMEALLKATGTAAPMKDRAVALTEGRVVVARNAESFSFIYQETLDCWRDVSFFDPERDVPALEQADLLYLPGGYPEKHLEALVRNAAARAAIRDYAERGGHIVAECGGMMYLCRSIVTDDGEYPMCGVLPYTITARTADRKLSLGYRRFVLDGQEFRGHEFHYTQFLGEIPPSAVQVYDAKGEPVSTPVFRYKNVLASYTHLGPHLRGSHPQAPPEGGEGKGDSK